MKTPVTICWFGLSVLYTLKPKTELSLSVHFSDQTMFLLATHAKLKGEDGRGDLQQHK